MTGTRDSGRPSVSLSSGPRPSRAASHVSSCLLKTQLSPRTHSVRALSLSLSLEIVTKSRDSFFSKDNSLSKNSNARIPCNHRGSISIDSNRWRRRWRRCGATCARCSSVPNSLKEKNKTTREVHTPQIEKSVLSLSLLRNLRARKRAKRYLGSKTLIFQNDGELRTGWLYWSDFLTPAIEVALAAMISVSIDREFYVTRLRSVFVDESRDLGRSMVFWKAYVDPCSSALEGMDRYQISRCLCGNVP